MVNLTKDTFQYFINKIKELVNGVSAKLNGIEEQTDKMSDYPPYGVLMEIVQQMIDTGITNNNTATTYDPYESSSSDMPSTDMTTDTTNTTGFAGTTSAPTTDTTGASTPPAGSSTTPYAG